ncbi:MAG: response regulator [Pseudomonadota bacterium]
MAFSRDILVIDDNEDDFELCERLLSKQSEGRYRLRHARSGNAGLAEIQVAEPDAILLDYSLPGAGGGELLAKIREKNAFLPVIMLTGQGNEAIAVKLLKAGAHDYMTKRSLSGQRLHTVISEALAESAQRAKQTEGAASSALVLIVDDSPEDRERCVRSLRQIASVNYSILEAGSGAAAQGLLKTNQPDCVLLDYSLPGRDGLDILRDLARDYPFLPVIMMTGHGNETIAVQAIKRGAQNYLVKSELSPNTLHGAIASAMDHGRLQQALREKEQALIESEERFALAASGASVGIWDWTDVEHDKEWWSPIFFQLLGYEDGAVAPSLQSFRRLLHPEDHERTFSAFKDHFEKRAPFKLEYRLKHRTKGYRWFLGSGQASWDESGRARRMTGSIMDIHDLKTTQATLEERTEKLERSNEELDHFAYIASHDLRAPLRGMDNVAKWIEDDLPTDADAGLYDKLRLLRGRVARMEQLLLDILAYSRAGRRESKPEEIDCSAVLREVVRWTAPPATFSVCEATQLPQICVSRTLLEQVLLNLISNAIKHHDRGSGEVRISYAQQGDFHEFIVEDDGPGIPPQYQERVFAMFQTLKSRDKVEGSGIGLAIVKKMVDAIGGSVTLESPVNERGSAFHVRLPMAQGPIVENEGASHDEGAARQSAAG